MWLFVLFSFLFTFTKSIIYPPSYCFSRSVDIHCLRLDFWHLSDTVCMWIDSWVSWLVKMAFLTLSWTVFSSPETTKTQQQEEGRHNPDSTADENLPAVWRALMSTGQCREAHIFFWMKHFYREVSIAYICYTINKIFNQIAYKSYSSSCICSWFMRC